MADHDWAAMVAALPDFRDQGHFTEESGAELLGDGAPTAFAKNAMLLPGRINEVAHIFDYS